METAFDLSPEGADSIVSLTRTKSALQSTLRRIIGPARLVPWPDRFQALRRSCETQPAATKPQHAVSAWFGHSMKVSERYYLQLTDDLYDRATGRAAESAAVRHRTDSQCEAGQDKPEKVTDQPREGKPASCKTLRHDAGLCDSEADGTRTRNHRIDSPVL